MNIILAVRASGLSLPSLADVVLEGTKGGPKEWVVVSHNRFGRVLLAILYMYKPSCRPMLKPPFLGTP